MILDGHLHLTGKCTNDKGEFLENMKTNGISGGLMISLPPVTFGGVSHGYTNDERLRHLMKWVDGAYEFYPFYWLNPLEQDAEKQVDKAVKSGVRGFKIICGGFRPGNEQAMHIYEIIAETGRPVLFHSGILFDGEVSSKFNRPLEFEVLVEIRGIKFALAHVGWPWCDEYIALYGKFLAAYDRRPDRSGEMFVDLTPGAPGVYRRGMMEKLFGTGYSGIMEHVFFGTDCKADSYNREYAGGIISKDMNILYDMGFREQEKEKIFLENVRRFVN